MRDDTDRQERGRRLPAQHWILKPPAQADRPARPKKDKRSLGFFYVTVVDPVTQGDPMRVSRVAALAGPFRTKKQAEKWVERAMKLAQELDPWGVFYAYGVSRLAKGYDRPGKLNERLGVKVSVATK